MATFCSYKMTDKLTRAQREQIIFKHLKGQDDPLYEVQQTNHGKYIVRQKQIQLEEESVNEVPEPEPVETSPIVDRQIEAKRERRRRNRRAKQDAKRILDALNNLISSNNASIDDDSTEDASDTQPQVQPIVRYKRRVLRFQ